MSYSMTPTTYQVVSASLYADTNGGLGYNKTTCCDPNEAWKMFSGTSMQFKLDSENAFGAFFNGDLTMVVEIADSFGLKSKLIAPIESTDSTTHSPN